MVEKQFILTVLRQLEKYLILKNGFHLSGETYDLILLVPSDRFSADAKYSLVVSCKKFDSLNRKTAISDLLSYLKDTLSFGYYNILSRINFIHSNDPFVKSMKMVFAFRDPLVEIVDYPIAGVRIEFAYLVKSLILDRLIENNAVTLEFQDHGAVQKVNAGVIRMDHNFELVYFTGKGLREIWKPVWADDANAKYLRDQTEDFLQENGYIDKVSFDAIINVL